MSIKHTCSNGQKVSQVTINKRRSDTYKKLYEGNPHPRCAGCGARATETSHILAQNHVKTLHKTELCWEPINMFPACRRCHMAWENIYNPAWCDLMNVEKLLRIIQILDPQTYEKRIQIYQSRNSA